MTNSRVKIKIITSQEISKAEVKKISQAYNLNQKFFGFSLKNLKVIICHSKSEWKTNSKYYYFEFARGVVLRDGTVVVKSKKLGQKSITQWGKILAHEINHSYWCAIRENSKNRSNLWAPIWLAEALACHTAKNDIVQTKQTLRRKINKQNKVITLPYRYSSSLFKTPEDVKLLYTAWTHFLDYLICNGLDKRSLLKLIKISSNKDSLEKYFEVKYKARLNYLFKTWLNSINHSN